MRRVEEMGPRVVEHRSPTGHRRRNAEAEEAQCGFRQDGCRHAYCCLHDHRLQNIWKNVACEDAEIVCSESTGRFHVFAFSRCHHLSAHETGVVDPAGDGECENDIAQARAEEGNECDGKENPRQRHEGVHDVDVEQGVAPAAVEACNATDQSTEDKGETYDRNGYGERDTRAKERAREDVSSQFVGAKPVTVARREQTCLQIECGRIVWSDPWCQKSRDGEDSQKKKRGPCKPVAMHHLNMLPVVGRCASAGRAVRHTCAMAELDREISSTGKRDGNEFRTILGVRFFAGSLKGAVDRMLHGGLLVVPSAPVLRLIETDLESREALLEADFVIADSAYMVLVWQLLQWEKIPRISGLAYLDELLSRPEMKRPEETVWVMARPKSAETNRAWLQTQGIDPPDSHIYLAPVYPPGPIQDPVLLEMLERLRPRHVIMTIGGGSQERLGLYLRRNLSFVPGIHCIGAAIAFLSGDQVKVPMWADKFYLGWLIRTMDNPKLYGPRYASSFALAKLMFRFRSMLPPLKQGS